MCFPSLCAEKRERRREKEGERERARARGNGGYFLLSVTVYSKRRSPYVVCVVFVAPPMLPSAQPSLLVAPILPSAQPSPPAHTYSPWPAFFHVHPCTQISSRS